MSASQFDLFAPAPPPPPPPWKLEEPQLALPLAAEPVERLSIEELSTQLALAEGRLVEERERAGLGVGRIEDEAALKNKLGIAARAVLDLKTRKAAALAKQLGQMLDAHDAS